MTHQRNPFALSPLMNALSLAFAGMMFSNMATAAQCGASGGTVSSAEKANCTISTASSTLTLDAQQNGWLRFTGGNGTLNVGKNGSLLINPTSGAQDYAAISVYDPVGTWTLNNQGTLKADNITADIVNASNASGKYVINNSGTMEFTGGAIDPQKNIFNARGSSQVDFALNNSGAISTSGMVLNFESGNDRPINITNEASGTIASTHNDILITSGGTSSDITLSNKGKISAGRHVINTNTSGNITVNNNDGAQIIADGVFVNARSQQKASKTTIKNGATASVTSTSKDSTAEFIYSNGYLDLENKGIMKAEKATWLIAGHGGSTIVNDTSGVIEDGGNGGAVIWLSAEGVTAGSTNYMADVKNKGTIKATGNNYGILSSAGTFNLDNSGTLSAVNRAISIENASSAHTIINTGTISSSNADQTIYADGKNTIVNGGTITNDRANGNAIYTTGYDDSLTLLPGSTIKGIVQLSGGKNTLILGGDTGQDTFDISQVGNTQQYRGLNNSTFTKDGQDTWTLIGDQSADQTWQAVSVKAGTLAFGDNVNFDNNTKAYDLTIADGATVDMGSSAYLNVNGKITVNGVLNVTTGERPTDNAAVVTKSSEMGSNSALNVSGFSAPVDASNASKAYSRTLIMTSEDGFSGIAEPFASVKVAGISVNEGIPDYISDVTHGASGNNYYLGTGLNWFAGACSDSAAVCYGVIDPANAMGSFTLTHSTDAFNVDVALTDVGVNGDKWDGKTLTKNGDGTLTLSQVNSYTGDTNIQHGVLSMGVADAIATSSNVILTNLDSKLVLNDFDQKINNLSGAGDVDLGSATLTNSMDKDAELSGVISGTGNLALNGNTVFTLSNDNTYTGNTTVTGGTLQLGNGSLAGSVTSDVTNEGTVIFNRSSDLTYNNVISGSGDVVKQGTNTLLFSKDQTYTGSTDIKTGAVILNQVALASSAVTVGSDAILAGYGSVAGDVTNNGIVAVADAAPSIDGFDNSKTGNMFINGNFINNGTVVMESPVPASTLTISGDYIGNNGSLVIDTVLEGDDSATDKLIVKGNTAGNTNVYVTNVGGKGAQTVDGIEIVDVAGESNGTFKLNGRAVAGMYDYDLYQGSVNDPTDGDWYLRTADKIEPIPTPEPTPEPEIINPVRPEVGSYLGNQSASVQMFQHELHDRVGSYPLAQQSKENDGLVPAFWARVVTNSSTNSSSEGIDNKTDMTVFQLGNDFTQLTSNGIDSTHIGFMLGYGHADTDSTNPNAYKSDAQNAKGKVDGYSVGAYGTWYQNAKTNAGCTLTVLSSTPGIITQ